MYTSRRLEDKDYKDIQTLYKSSFNSDHSISYIQKKYDTSVFGEKNTGMLAYSEQGEVAAYYGVFPMRLDYDGKEVMIAQSGDTMTHANHRKKGLFTRLAKETYELSKKLNIQLVFGFPNEFSYPGFKKKLDWVFTGNMQKFSIKSKALPLCELAKAKPQLKSWYQGFVERRIKKFEISKAQINYEAFNYKTSKACIKRDANFFDQKLAKEDIYMVQIDGIQMIIKANTHLYIGEITKITTNDVATLMKAVHKLAKRLKCGKIEFIMSENHWLFPLLSTHVSPEESLPIGFYKINDDIEVEKIQFNMVDYDTF